MTTMSVLFGGSWPSAGLRVDGPHPHGYTAGWVVEIVTRRLSPKGRPAVGPVLLKLGLTFSVLATVSPAAFWGARWAAHAAGFRR